MFIDKDISSKGNFLTPVSSIFVSVLERGHEILQSTQVSSQISGVSERKKVEVRFICRMKTCNPSNYLFEVVVSDFVQGQSGNSSPAGPDRLGPLV